MEWALWPYASAMAACPFALVAGLWGPGAQEAATALASLTSLGAAICSPLVEAGALPSLVALLQNGTDLAKSSAAVAVGNIAITNGKSRMRLVDLGVLPLLVALLEMGTDLAKSNAAAALHHIAAYVAPAQWQAVEVGALPPLVALLTTGDGLAKSNAAAALCCIASSTALCQRVVEAGALPPLVALLTTGTDLAKSSAAEAISHIASSSLRLHPRIIQAGAVPPLVSLLACANTANEHAAHALCHLASGDLRDTLSRCGAVAHLAGLSVSPLSSSHAKLYASFAISLLCRTRESLHLAVGESMLTVWATMSAQQAELEACRAEKAARTSELRALAAAAAAGDAAHCDVTFKCADGVELGASRFLLVQTCPYYRSLFESGSAEVGSGVVVVDADFSSAAHAALLRQLHSLGEAALPEEADGVLELLKLAAKLQPPASRSAGPQRGAARVMTLERVLARCEAAIIGGLDVSNCIDVLLHVKSCGSFPRIVEAAEALVKDRLEEVIAQPRWEAFAEELPREAMLLMKSVALQMRRGSTASGSPGAGMPRRPASAKRARHADAESDDSTLSVHVD